MPARQMRRCKHACVKLEKPAKLLPKAAAVCSSQAAVAKAKTKFKPLIDEEDERRRASAAAKLRALDEAIAKRKAEEERCVACYSWLCM